MSLRKTHGTDKRLEVEGVTIPVDINEHNGKPIEITISRMGTANKRYTARLEEVMRPHQSSLQNDAMDNDLAGKLLQEVFADTVLLGWNNLPKSELTGNDEDNDELPFERANILALFEELPGLYKDWEAKAKASATFRKATQAAVAKN